MANFLYDKGLEGIGDHSIDLLADNLKVMLVTSAYSPIQASDKVVTDVTSGIVARSGNLASKTVTGKVFDAADITLTAVTGSAVSQIVLYKDTGSDATSRLVARFDTATGLPFTPSGADVPIVWDNGSNKIFAL